jgi:two-component system invasion response regulator UvrY
MKILIADDHSIFRNGLIALLRSQFMKAEIAETTNGGDAIEKAREGSWDIILLDVSMPGLNGIDTLKQMRTEGIQAPVLFLSMHPEEQYAVRALKAGASGFISKESTAEELIAAVRKVLNGKKYISELVSEKLADSFSIMSGKLAHEELSDREMQVLTLIASGKTISEIGVEIHLSVHTISTYRARILKKLSLRTNAELTRYAMDNKFD